VTARTVPAGVVPAAVRSGAKEAGAYRVYALVLVALAAAFFPRVLTAAGAPALLNFVHFGLVTALFALVCFRLRRRSVPLVVGLILLFAAIATSALVNGAGLVNVVLDFLLLAEPFLLLAAIVNARWSPTSIVRFRFWLFAFAAVNVAFAYFQYGVLGNRKDFVQGVFPEMGAGHHVAGAVALSAALYFFADFPLRARWLRFVAPAIAAFVVVLTDAKQVMAVFLAALLVLMVVKARHLGAAFKYLSVGGASVVAIFFLAYTVHPTLKSWARLDLIQKGLEQKLSVFPIITSFYETPLNWLVGLGPGHTVGRLGWLLPDYSQYLMPLGATIHPATEAVWGVQDGHWMTNVTTGSSMWSLLFSWSGVWGDLGLLGLAVYAGLWLLVWRRVCLDDLQRFLLLTMLVFGAVFSWMEEPGYMLFVVSLIGLRWQEKRHGASEPKLRPDRSTSHRTARHATPAPPGLRVVPRGPQGRR